MSAKSEKKNSWAPLDQILYLLLDEVVAILQVGESTFRTLQNINSDTRNAHYVKYDKKMSGSKDGKVKHSTFLD